MQLNFAAREVAIKLVYYGPALSGKTTNLKMLHELVVEQSRGRLMTLDTKDDRTLFFDMLPIAFKTGGDGGMSARVKVFTVPGQVVHASTRRLVLQGADGIVFVADSQLSEIEDNAKSFLELRDNLKALGQTLTDVPLVIQFNKRDLPNIRPDDEIEDLARRGREPVFKASALTGTGVIECFFGVLDRAWRALDREHDFTTKLGIEPTTFVERAAESLGYGGKVDALLAACVSKKGSSASVAGADGNGNEYVGCAGVEGDADAGSARRAAKGEPPP